MGRFLVDKGARAFEHCRSDGDMGGLGRVGARNRAGSDTDGGNLPRVTQAQW